MIADAEPGRALGFWMCLALVIGNFIGAGVFLLPAALAPYGLNAVIGWLITIGGALCLAFLLARLAIEYGNATPTRNENDGWIRSCNEQPTHGTWLW